MKQLLTLSLLALATCARALPLEQARIAKVVGQVDVRQGNSGWRPARIGGVLGTGDEVHTGVDSEATLEFPGQAAMVIKELTDIGVGTLLNQQGRIKVRVLLRVGETTARVKPKQATPPDFAIETPTATASIRGTEFRLVSYHPARGTETELLSGHALVRSRRGVLQVGPREPVRSPPDGQLAPPRALQADASRVQVEPPGFTRREHEQIKFNNQPNPAPRPPPMPPPPPPP